MKRACVIGDPVAHSRSPLIHGFWLAELGLEGVYERRHVRKGELSSFITELRAGGYRGCNVTLPHKEGVVPLIDEPTELVRQLGAANTIWLDANNRLHADNTDVHGFLANLDQGAPGWRDRSETALILGAGGAARAVLLALKNSGIERIIIANRTLERALALIEGRRGVEVLPLQKVGKVLPETDLLVNTTQLGMVGQPDHSFGLASLKPSALVHDIVYVPLETKLMRQARSRGHQIVGGLGMLLHQAVPGFEQWFGKRPEVTAALYDHIARDIPLSL